VSRTSATLSRVETLDRALARVATDESLNIWSHLAIDEARVAAHECDARRANGESKGPLDGELVALKANIAVRGWPHDGGLPIRAGLHATEDAPVVERLRAAGAILLGQTRMDAGALGAEGRSTLGPIRNPHRVSHSAGGSSGGSAAAIAAGHCRIALGTDTIGSVRIPASYCGISSLKPGAGRISLDGVLPVHTTFDHVGPMTRSAALLEPVLRSIADPATGFRDEPWKEEPSNIDALRESRVGYLVDLVALKVNAGVQRHYAHGLELLRSRGAHLQPVELAGFELHRVRKAVFALCEHAMWQQHHESLARQPERYPAALASMLRYGGSLDAAKIIELETRVAEFRRAVRRLVDTLDALVLPTTPSQAFAFDDDAPTDLADLTALASAASLPAASVPLPTMGDLPVGMQIVVAEGAEIRACRMASAFEAT